MNTLKTVIENILKEARVNPKQVEQTPIQKRFRLNAIKQFARSIIDLEDQVGFVKRQLLELSEKHPDKNIQANALEVLSSLESFKRARKKLSIDLMQLLMKVSKL